MSGEEDGSPATGGVQQYVRVLDVAKRVPGTRGGGEPVKKFLQLSRSTSRADAQSVAVARQHRAAPLRLVPEFKEVITIHTCCTKVNEGKEVATTRVPRVLVGARCVSTADTMGGQGSVTV